MVSPVIPVRPWLVSKPNTDTVVSPVIPVRPWLVSKPNTGEEIFWITLEESGKPKNSNLPVHRICFAKVSAKRGNTSN